MAAKTIVFFCAQALLAQLAFGACLGGLAGPGPYGLAGVGPYGAAGLGAAGLGLAGAGCGCGVASSGGGLPVASASAIAPVGISVLSENAYEGRLCAGGNLPFLGTVGIEGVLPTAGAGAVNYGCGGAIGIGAEGPINTGIVGAGPYGAGIGAYGAGIGPYGAAGIGGCGCGCGAWY